MLRIRRYGGASKYEEKDLWRVRRAGTDGFMPCPRRRQRMSSLNMTAWAKAELVRRQVSSPELVEAAIARIEKINPVLNAVVHKLYDDGRAAANGPLPDGPFTGVPISSKTCQSWKARP